jgi:hypothetical protein
MGREWETYEENRNVYRISVGNIEENIPLERPRRRWKITLKLVLKKWYRGMCARFFCLRIGTNEGFNDNLSHRTATTLSNYRTLSLNCHRNYHCKHSSWD